MSERRPGYYMIRYAHEQAPWEPAEWDGERWVLLGNSSPFSPATIGEIGPRIPTPDEPWQCVPVEVTEEMEYRGALEQDVGADPEAVYQAMLSAAPKPEDS